MADAPDWEIAEVDGAWHAAGQVNLTVLDGGRCWKRRAIKKPMGGGEARHVCVLVGELDGVRLYYDGGDTLLLTKQDLYP